MGPELRKYATTLDSSTAGSLVVRGSIRKAGSADFATSSDWTPATGDVKVSKDGGAQANIGTLPSYSNGSWEFILSGTELTAKSVRVVVVDSATKAVDDFDFEVHTYGNASAMYATDYTPASIAANVTQFGGTNGTFAGGRPEVALSSSERTTLAGAIKSGFSGALLLHNGSVTAYAAGSDTDAARGAAILAAQTAAASGDTILVDCNATLDAVLGKDGVTYSVSERSKLTNATSEVFSDGGGAMSFRIVGAGRFLGTGFTAILASNADTIIDAEFDTAEASGTGVTAVKATSGLICVRKARRIRATDYNAVLSDGVGANVLVHWCDEILGGDGADVANEVYTENGAAGLEVATSAEAYVRCGVLSCGDTAVSADSNFKRCIVLADHIVTKSTTDSGSAASRAVSVNGNTDAGEAVIRAHRITGMIAFDQGSSALACRIGGASVQSLASGSANISISGNGLTLEDLELTGATVSFFTSSSATINVLGSLRYAGTKDAGVTLSYLLGTRAGQQAIETDTQDLQSRLGDIEDGATVIRADDRDGAAIAKQSTASSADTQATSAAANALTAASKATAIQADYARRTDGLSDQAKLDINAEADTALSDYAPQTAAQATSDITDILAAISNVPGLTWAVSDRSLTATERTAIATALLDYAEAIETGITPRGALRLLLAAQAGKVSGAGTGTETFRNAAADTKNRIVATVDSSGNRTALTLDVTD